MLCYPFTILKGKMVWIIVFENYIFWHIICMFYEGCSLFWGRLQGSAFSQYLNNNFDIPLTFLSDTWYADFHVFPESCWLILTFLSMNYSCLVMLELGVLSLCLCWNGDQPEGKHHESFLTSSAKIIKFWKKSRVFHLRHWVFARIHALKYKILPATYIFNKCN